MAIEGASHLIQKAMVPQQQHTLMNVPPPLQSHSLSQSGHQPPQQPISKGGQVLTRSQVWKTEDEDTLASKEYSFNRRERDQLESFES